MCPCLNGRLGAHARWRFQRLMSTQSRHRRISYRLPAAGAQADQPFIGQVSIFKGIGCVRRGLDEMKKRPSEIKAVVATEEREESLGFN